VTITTPIIASIVAAAAGLPGTRVDIPGPHAIGYERFPGPGATPEDPKYGEVIDATRQNPSWGGPAGDMISTTRDTQRFLRALIGGTLLRPAELAEMQRTVPLNESFHSIWPGAGYGLGLFWKLIDSALCRG